MVNVAGREGSREKELVNLHGAIDPWLGDQEHYICPAVLAVDMPVG